MTIKTRIRMPWLEGLPWNGNFFRFEATWYYKDDDGLRSVRGIVSPLLSRKETQFADEYYEMFKEIVDKELKQFPEMPFNEETQPA